MNDFKKHINKVEADYVDANPIKSDWNSFSSKLKPLTSVKTFIGIVAVVVITSVSLFVFDKQQIEIVEEYQQEKLGVENDEVETVITVSKTEALKLKKPVIYKPSNKERQNKQVLIDSSNNESLPDSVVKQENEEGLRIKISEDDFELFINKINYCAEDTLKASFVFSNHLNNEDSIVSVSWLINNEVYHSNLLKLSVFDLKGDVEGSLIVETNTSMIKKDFWIHIYEAGVYNVQFEENESLKKSVSISVDDLKEMKYFVNGHLLEEYTHESTAVYEYNAPGEYVFLLS